MMRRFPLVFLLLVFPSYVAAIELVTNGDFESDLAPAWQEESVGAAVMIGRSVTFDVDPDYEVVVQKATGNGYGKLIQPVVVPATDLDFSVNAKIQVSATSGGPWAAAGVALHYEDSLGDVLGTTMIVRVTAECPWIDSDTFHMIPAPDEEWNAFSFNVDDELANLPGVDMMAIHQIRIVIFGQVGGDC
jgi:hypothetical protein